MNDEQTSTPALDGFTDQQLISEVFRRRGVRQSVIARSRWPGDTDVDLYVDPWSAPERSDRGGGQFGEFTFDPNGRLTRLSFFETVAR
ncbi:hypothetical protein [Ornithinimicrobium murale]|uniref:hypothetical protein n=1 Tax=Ornithinimicrobium murale TaxID=1050153 RepID=UPI0013B3855E|nr:hypothetical protein [Ornithinimicrobium murale]